MSVMPCTRATFVKKNSCLVARIVTFDTAGLHLLVFRILSLISVMLSHINGVIIVPSNKILFGSMLSSFGSNFPSC